MDNNDVPFSIFLDLSKTFYTIDHSILLNKLRYYGLDDYSLNLFKSYLSNRRQYTEFENWCTTRLYPWSPVIYNIYYNIYFPKASKKNCIMYADNTTLFSTIKSFNDNLPNSSTESAINDEELLKIFEWLNINKLPLNRNKSKYMTFQMPNKVINYFTLNINNTNIEQVEELYFLGLTLI